MNQEMFTILTLNVCALVWQCKWHSIERKLQCLLIHELHKAALSWIGRQRSVTTSERETVRQTVSGPFQWLHRSADNRYLHTDDRKCGGDKENPAMAHWRAKIGHLAREPGREGEEKNQKEGKIGAQCFYLGTFLLLAWDQKGYSLMLANQ